MDHPASNPHAIFLPVLALIGWTLLVLLLIPYRRFKAAFAGQVRTDDFKVGESSQVPSAVSLPNRVFLNLLEVPLLFYVVCLVAHATQQVTAGAVGLAWTYVGLRVLHSLVYLTWNHVLHRFLVFAASNVVLLLLGGGLLRRWLP